MSGVRLLRSPSSRAFPEGTYAIMKERTHVKQVQVSEPGLLIILVDQSYSMSEAYGAGTKKDFAALAINRCIYEIIAQCKRGSEIRDRCQLGVCGYGDGGASWLIGGPVSKIATKALRVDSIPRKVPDGAGGLIDSPLELPIWIEAHAPETASTPMDQAFKLAAEKIRESWLPKYPDSFPPVVINITDGEPDDSERGFEASTREAKALTDLKSSDGNTLLFNAHISSKDSSEVVLPANPPADRFARFLFDISSVVPQTLLDRAAVFGLSSQQGSRACVYNAGAETLVRLINFGSSQHAPANR
jgi:hypothetical protein